MNNSYIKRISDEKLALLLQTKGAVLIEGAKWCGKKSSAEEIAKNVFVHADADTSKANILTAKTMQAILSISRLPSIVKTLMTTVMTSISIEFWWFLQYPNHVSFFYFGVMVYE